MGLDNEEEYYVYVFNVFKFCSMSILSANLRIYSILYLEFGIRFCCGQWLYPLALVGKFASSHMIIGDTLMLGHADSFNPFL